MLQLQLSYNDRLLGLDPQDPREALVRGRQMARAWAATFDARRRGQRTAAFVGQMAASYWEQATGQPLDLDASAWPGAAPGRRSLDRAAGSLARAIGHAAAQLPPEEAGYALAVTYSVMLPPDARRSAGIYYTPPVLVSMLLEMAEEAGVDWATARVADPACGGGAFLAPVAARMAAAIEHAEPELVLRQLAGRLRGFEIDPLGAWLAQLLVEVAVWPVCRKARQRLPQVVTVCDSLDVEPGDDEPFDLVIGNPPYGRTKLDSDRRKRFARSLFGHANLYGVFTDLALRWARSGGILAYVTPTSFLSGEYFKALRRVLGSTAPPVTVAFVTDRKGVFEDVLQETLLATYRRGADPQAARVRFIAASSEVSADAQDAGSFYLPSDDPSAPWILPRVPEDMAVVSSLRGHPCRLDDYGYAVSTGPLVWNRHKSQLRDGPGRGCYPLVWAESVLPGGTFRFRAERRNHKPYFELHAGDDWLAVDRPCILVQRTTAKEQRRRLIAAELPRSFLRRHKRAVVENHLNMVYPSVRTPRVSPGTVAALLNSAAVDRVFRCISGSVAVSAYELMALPLPSFDRLGRLEGLVHRGASQHELDVEVSELYNGVRA